MKENEVSLEMALSEIAQSCEETVNLDVYRSPYFLIIGAGVSNPPVPLASNIINHCKELSSYYNRSIDPKNFDDVDIYSHWFKLAYPNAGQRQQYLCSLIEKQPLSSASLRLAHLLSSKRLTNLVITTNFDDFIHRALRLFGEDPTICDHPSTVERIDPQRNDIQIVHVHGSYLFYDCANLRAEIVDRAVYNQESSLTMIGLLDNILWTRSPLVIGYSGWDNDVIMTALKRRLGGGKPISHNIYWFCYRNEDKQKLPEWLRSNFNVRFVVPSFMEEEDAECNEIAEKSKLLVKSSKSRDLIKGRNQKYIDSDRDAKLSALTVFDQINLKLDIGLPALFKNPLGQFSSALEASLPAKESLSVGEDLYAFKAVLYQIKEAEKYLLEKSHKAVNEVDSLFKEMQKLKMESKYKSLATILAQIIPHRLDQLEKEERVEVLKSADLISGQILKKNFSIKSIPAIPAAVSVSYKYESQYKEFVDNNFLIITTSHLGGQYSFETRIDGKSFGCMTYYLANSLNDNTLDSNNDGKISIHEAVVGAISKILMSNPDNNLIGSSPVVVGNANDIYFFSSRLDVSNRKLNGNLICALIGAGSFKKAGYVSAGLAGPSNDVNLLQKILSTKKNFLYNSAKVKVLKNNSATFVNVKKLLEWIVKYAKEEDTVLFFFSGHTTEIPILKKGQEKDNTEQIVVHCLNDFDGKKGYISDQEVFETFRRSRAKFKIFIKD